jgi:benzoyl-CoA reductase subunit B
VNTSASTPPTASAVSEKLRSHLRHGFKGLHEQAATGAPFAVAGPNNPHEILRAFDIPFMVDVWYSGLIAARQEASHYQDVLERHGYHRSLDTYGAHPLAVWLDNQPMESRPWGGFPKPSLIVANRTWPSSRESEILALVSGAQYFGLDLPAVMNPQPDWWSMGKGRGEDFEGSDRVDAIEKQLWELVHRCEKLTGRKLDQGRLAKIIERSDAQMDCLDDVREMIRSAPKLAVPFREVMGLTLGLQWLRGTDFALALAQEFRDDVAAKVRDEQWVCPNERQRLMYVGRGLWQQLGFFSSFEESHGAVFVRSNYLSWAVDGYRRFAPNPIRSLAIRYATFTQLLHLPPWAGEWAAWDARKHRVDRAVQIGEGFGERLIARTLERDGIPVLRLEVDPLDARSWNPEEVSRVVGRFLES